jgi:transcriptional regulator with XRE-family HTH domain
MNSQDLQKIVGSRLKELRGNMTQNEIAKAIDINRHTISAYESGDVLPPIDKLIRFANLYNVSIDYLCGNSDVRVPVKYDVGDKLGLTDDSIAKMQGLAEKSKEQPLIFGLDTVNYFLKYGTTEFFEFISEYLNVPLVQISNNDSFITTKKDKEQIISFRKQKAEEYMVFEEMKKMFDRIKSSEEVHLKYEKYKNHIEKFDRPFHLIDNDMAKKILDE